MSATAKTRINILNLRNTIIDGGAEKAILNWHAYIDKSRFNYSLASFNWFACFALRTLTFFIAMTPSAM
jgi:hypothetical protein